MKEHNRVVKRELKFGPQKGRLRNRSNELNFVLMCGIYAMMGDKERLLKGKKKKGRI